MEDKYDEILKQYPFQIKNKRRVRGAVMVENSQGTYMLRDSRASEFRLKYEEAIKEKLIEKGCIYVDQTCKTEKGEYHARDRYGNYWVLRRWYGGTECDVHKMDDICRCSKHLAHLHQCMVIADQESEQYMQEEDILERMNRHNRELKRLHGYIRNKKQKNEMEIYLLKSFDLYFEQACQAQEIIQADDYKRLATQTREQGCICHGNYNYHNVLLAGVDIITINFDRAETGIQVQDLYGFVRKTMEKNHGCRLKIWRNFW